jgi:tetrahydromethanopterin S-methyltransferase subunit A
LGCKHCWSAELTNVFDDAFSELNSIHSIENQKITKVDLDLLPAVGEYHVLSLDDFSPIAISTLGNSRLADKIAELKPRGLSIVGKTETENIGIEKIIKNILATPSIRYLILCGNDPEGHYSGNTLLSLVDYGVESKMRVIGSKGKKPVLSNTTMEEVDAFRNQIEVTNLIDCEDINTILEAIQELLGKATLGSREDSSQSDVESSSPSIEIITAEEKDPFKIKLDKHGYFVIIPKTSNKMIFVEHYSSNDQLLHMIKGENARNIYLTIIENGWVSEMGHAAYLGKELTKAEMSMKLGFKYIQDKA